MTVFVAVRVNYPILCLSDPKDQSLNEGRHKDNLPSSPLPSSLLEKYILLDSRPPIPFNVLVVQSEEVREEKDTLADGSVGPLRHTSLIAGLKQPMIEGVGRTPVGHRKIVSCFLSCRRKTWSSISSLKPRPVPEFLLPLILFHTRFKVTRVQIFRSMDVTLSVPKGGYLNSPPTREKILKGSTLSCARMTDFFLTRSFWSILDKDKDNLIVLKLIYSRIPGSSFWIPPFQVPKYL